jgi:hypothetical protein
MRRTLDSGEARMAVDPKGPRERPEDKAQRITDDAKAHVDKEREAVRKKTERLRNLRLAKEAVEGVTEIDKKPAARKNRTATR